MNQPENIPLLTDIIQLGDEDMKNHFDGHVFDEGADNTDDDIDIDLPQDHGDDIPQIHLDDDTDTDLDDLQINPLEEEDIPELSVDQDMPEAEASELADEEATTEQEELITDELAVADEQNSPGSMSRDEIKSMVELLVSDAVDATLPVIEAQLKQSISEQIIQKLSRELDNEVPESE